MRNAQRMKEEKKINKNVIGCLNNKAICNGDNNKFRASPQAYRYHLHCHPLLRPTIENLSSHCCTCIDRNFREHFPTDRTQTVCIVHSDCYQDCICKWHPFR